MIMKKFVIKYKFSAIYVQINLLEICKRYMNQISVHIEKSSVNYVKNKFIF